MLRSSLSLRLRCISKTPPPSSSSTRRHFENWPGKPSDDPNSKPPSTTKDIPPCPSLATTRSWSSPLPITFPKKPSDSYVPGSGVSSQEPSYLFSAEGGDGSQPSAERPYVISTTTKSPEFEDVLRKMLTGKDENLEKFVGLGVIKKDVKEDVRLLISNYTAVSLALALRDREDTLQLAADLLLKGKMTELNELLSPHEKQYVELRRRKKIDMDLNKGFDIWTLEMLRKYLARMPRQVTKAHRHRAAIVIPLCNLNGIPSVLFEKRALQMRTHPGEVCFPGGMLSEGDDHTIVSTCLREMTEEIGLPEEDVNVLGILRCNWSEVTAFTGIAVTPVVGYVGELGNAELKPNPDEVAECFTIPLEDILNDDKWVRTDASAPIFKGGPYVIWGLTGYVLDRFVRDVLRRYRIDFKGDMIETDADEGFAGDGPDGIDVIGIPPAGGGSSFNDEYTSYSI